VVRPAILWNDGAAAECDLLHKKFPASSRRPAIARWVGFTAPAAVGAAHEPQVWKKVKTVLLPRITCAAPDGDNRRDVDGAGMLLMDVAKRRWSAKMLKLCNIDESSSVADRGQQRSPASHHRGAAELGIPAACRWSAAPATRRGCGRRRLRQPGATTIPSASGVVFTPPRAYSRKKPDACTPSATPSQDLHQMGVMLSAPVRWQWYRDTCAPGVDSELCARPPATDRCEGLTFCVYLTRPRAHAAVRPVGRGASIADPVARPQVPDPRLSKASASACRVAAPDPAAGTKSKRPPSRRGTRTMR